MSAIKCFFKDATEDRRKIKLIKHIYLFHPTYVLVLIVDVESSFANCPPAILTGALLDSI